MDDEIKQNLIKLEIIKQKVFTAFADVRLGNGIGFCEADPVYSYFQQTDEKYSTEREKDEREDFREVYNSTENFDLEGYYGSYHMDVKGLHFFLPVLLLRGSRDAMESSLLGLITAEKPEYIELMNLLTLEHKNCIIEYLEYAVDYDDWVKFYVDYKGQECHKCGKIHEPESFTLEQAKAEVESTDEYILLQYLKENLK